MSLIEVEIQKERDYVSFSELFLFSECPYKHWTTYFLKKREPHSIHSAFGTAIHNAIEQDWIKNSHSSWISMGKTIVLFCRYHGLPRDEIQMWFNQATRIYKDFLPWLNETFPGYIIFNVELKIEEQIPNFDRKFLGYIDLILYNPETDHYQIIDLKTSKLGWFGKFGPSTHKLYQVILYKKFFCEKENISPSKVECHYALMLRQPPKKEKYSIQLYSTTSGKKKIENATTWMEQSIAKMKAGIKIKSPITCSFCVCEYNKKKKKK